MKLSFYKYHGAGNDFILIDNRLNYTILSGEQIKFLCDRHLGIGADGLMLLNSDKNSDFRMKYYNSDGNESTMCGNGGRCITAFASQLGIIESKTEFTAIDGLHSAEIIEKHDNIKIIKLKMIDVNSIQKFNNYFVINTGSPHYIEFVKNVEDIDIVKDGRAIRYDNRFTPDGLNVNFVQIHPDYINVRTYERGVENETLSCGTGVTASALAYASELNNETVKIKTKGGNLNVSFEKQGDSFKNVYLEGPACFVYRGEIEI